MSRAAATSNRYCEGSKSKSSSIRKKPISAKYVHRFCGPGAMPNFGERRYGEVRILVILGSWTSTLRSSPKYVCTAVKIRCKSQL